MIVLAVHCVPFDEETGIESFWHTLHKLLQSKGSQLILVSTTHLKTPDIPVIYVPFDLSSVKEVFSPNDNTDDIRFGIGNIKFIENYYLCDCKEAEVINWSISKFVGELIQYFSPTCIISWQSADPLSHIFSIESKRMDIQYWSMERGWLPKTLMIDARDNNLLSEINLSIPSGRILSSYRSSDDTMQRVKSLINSGKQGRYRSTISADIKKELGLSQNTEIISVFTQLDRNSRHRGKPYRESIGFCLNSDVQFIDRLSKKVSSKDIAIIVQVHPLDDLNRFALCDNQNVFLVKGLIPIKLIDLSCAIFFGDTSLISLAIETGKPFGLINRSFLSGANTIRELQDFDDKDEFIETVLTQDKEILSLQNLAALEYLCFLYDAFLLDIANDATVSNSAEEVFKMLSKLISKESKNHSGLTTSNIEGFLIRYPTFRSLPY